jgi:hypothetical protein
MAISCNCIAPLRPECEALLGSQGSSPRPRQAVAPLDPIGYRSGAEIAAPRAPHVPGERWHRNVTNQSAQGIIPLRQLKNAPPKPLT